MVLCLLCKANELFADQIVKSAVHTEPSTDGLVGFALSNPNFLTTHTAQLIPAPISGSTATLKLNGLKAARDLNHLSSRKLAI